MLQLLKGSDPVLLDTAATAAVRAVVGDQDRAEVLEEFRGDDYDLGAVVLAARTVSMFGDRVVVARNLGRFAAAELTPLVELLGELPDGVGLVLVWDRPVTGGAMANEPDAPRSGARANAPDAPRSGARANAVPKKLSDAVKAAGGDVVDTSPPTGRGRQSWFDDQFAAGPVRLDAAARQLVEDTLGDDVSRLPGLLEVVAAANPGATSVGVDEVRPLLGDAGGVPPWELTDAIDKGATAGAVELVRRMLGGGGRHPLQVMVTLQSHFERMLRLDGAGVHDEKAAAALLGMKGSTFPAKKALAQCNRLGSAKLARATELLATADVELRGATKMPPEVVLELLVARLAAVSRLRRAPGG